MSETHRIVAGVTVIETVPDGPRGKWQFVYAPGAGSNINDPFGVFACHALAAQGTPSARFQFPYQQTGSRHSNHSAVLEGTWRAVLNTVRLSDANVVIGGRSMGGRVATTIVAAGADVAGLAAFAYPLHPPGHPEKARLAHLQAIIVPTLFCSGTRDTFGTQEELSAASHLVPNATVHMLDGADHGFAVPKRSERTKEEIYGEAVASLLAWATEFVDV